MARNSEKSLAVVQNGSNVVADSFNFASEKVVSLTYSQLERTFKENDIYGNPLKGIYHFELIRTISDIARDYNLDLEIYDLFAAQNNDKNSAGVVILPQIEEKYGKNAVEAHLLRRVFANIRLTNFDTDEFTSNLVIAFHQKGIQVAFGNMVIACHNQCILAADQVCSNYGDNKKTIPEMLDIIRGWFENATGIITMEREKIERMKSTQLDAQSLYVLIGMLTAMRVAHDSSNKAIRNSESYPLNQSQITQFTESLLIKQVDSPVITVWDVYNAANELYKGNTMEIPQVILQNRAMAEFIDKLYLS